MGKTYQKVEYTNTPPENIVFVFKLRWLPALIIAILAARYLGMVKFGEYVSLKSVEWQVGKNKMENVWLLDNGVMCIGYNEGCRRIDLVCYTDPNVLKFANKESAESLSLILSSLGISQEGIKPVEHCYPKELPKVENINGLPRRIQHEFLKPVELLAVRLVQEIEFLGSHPYLTDAVVAMTAVRSKLADWIELTATIQ